MKQLLPVRSFSLSLVLGLAACSPGDDKQSTETPATNTSAEASRPVAPPSSDANPSPASPAPAPSQAGTIIGLEGLGDLRLGQSVPRGSRWAERGAQTGGDCRTVSSPDYPGVYGMVVDREVRRITVGPRSDVKLAEGIGIGATERDVEKWFAGFRSEPHKYETAPAKYLTAPNAASGDAAVRFEIGQDGKVKLIHVGMMPQLAYVEGCA